MSSWTPGRLQAWVIAGLRSLSRKYPARYETLKEAQTEKKINVKTGRLAQHYECNECKEHFPATEVQVDHIRAVVDPTTGFVDFNTYIERLFCEKENLQVLCKPCHLIKSNLEKKCKSNKSSKAKTEPTASKARSRKKNTPSS